MIGIIVVGSLAIGFLGGFVTFPLMQKRLINKALLAEIVRLKKAAESQTGWKE